MSDLHKQKTIKKKVWAPKKIKPAHPPKNRIDGLSRPARRMLVNMLENAAHLEDDAARRPREFKALLRAIHPGEYDAPRVRKVMDDLMNGRLHKPNAEFENALKAADAAVFDAPAQPGTILRAFRKLYEADQDRAVEAFLHAAPHATTARLAELAAWLRSSGVARDRMIAPGGKWENARIAPADAFGIASEHASIIQDAIADLIAQRLRILIPEGIRPLPDFDKLESIKLPSNRQENASYGPGSTFSLPENTGFLRTATYWETTQAGATWFDNGFVFLDADMLPAGAVCWNQSSLGRVAPPAAKLSAWYEALKAHKEWAERHGNDHESHAPEPVIPPYPYEEELYDFHKPTKDVGAIFSGDPLNSSDLKGRACQMIDIYPQQALAHNARYAVWNVLCYSGVSFAQATGEVLATLQVGENQEAGDLYEPSRAMFRFPLRSHSNTSYVACIDLETRVVTYLDADLGGSPMSAVYNQNRMERLLPPLLKTLAARPSIRDVLACADVSPTGASVGYSDADGPVVGRAYLFSRIDPDSAIEPLQIEKILSAVGGQVDPSLRARNEYCPSP